MSGYVVNQSWRPLIGSRYEITYISARTHDSNEISTATLTFSRSSNSVELVPILPDVNGVGNPRWPPLNRKISFKFKTLLSEHKIEYDVESEAPKVL